MSETAFGRYRYTKNRELSWLQFNQRVLEEAADKNNPVLERLKFLAIFTSNLDEFFRVRVGSLVDISRISPEKKDNKSGMTSEEQLRKIYEKIPELIQQKKEYYRAVMQELGEQHIQDVLGEELKPKERKYVNQYFMMEIMPLLSPIIIGTHHPLPHLNNKQLHIAAALKDKKGKTAIGLIPIPENVPPYLMLPAEKEELRYIRTENILLMMAPDLFGAYTAEEITVLCVTRNADISFDDEKFDDDEEDLRNQITKLLKKRENLSAVRMEIGEAISEEFKVQLMKLMGVSPVQVYEDAVPLKMSYVYRLCGELPEEKTKSLLYPAYVPRWPEDLDQKQKIMDQVRRKDKLLFYPFDSVEPFLKLLGEAAESPDVVSIKITIYRLASSSKIARILCRAAENGKEVLVLMELRARFDEANNVAWSKLLEEAGCQVIYGMDGFKCHSKICLITRKERGKMSYITQIGTGNYNEKTNAMYTDLSLMTASPVIGEDAVAFFQNMLINKLNGDYRQLRVSPYGIKEMLIQRIDEQIRKGPEGYICFKVNAITERDIIDKLRQASDAGVEVRMIIRGISCILPGIPGDTENIHISSIVGRYLEHARIYQFGRGEDEKFYISSADLMTRNLNRRVEIACPIFDPDVRMQLRWMLLCQLRDNMKASIALSDGSYHRRRREEQASFNSQECFMEQTSHKVAAPAKIGVLQRLGAGLRRASGKVSRVLS